MSTPSRKYFDQLPKNVQENLTNNICSYDTNKDGILSREEFKNVLDAIGEVFHSSTITTIRLP
jgi:Ca2+-binding EF-hand superfamily protein